MKIRDTRYPVLAWSLLAFAFLMPISIALVQPAGYLAALASLYHIVIKRRGRDMSFPFRNAIIFFLAVLVVTAALGVRPGHSFEKMNRFVLFAAAWGIPLVVFDGRGGRSFLIRLCAAFVLGAAAKAYYDFIRVPLMVQLGTPVFETANMRDPQFYYAAMCLVVGMLITEQWRLKYPPTCFGLLATAGGLIIHFKRGAWASGLAALAVMALASRKWRYLGVVGILVMVLAGLPQTRERLADIREEFDSGRGGRLMLWTDVAPVLIKEHPAGMGWKGVRHEDFIAVNTNVEQDLDHLHNNLLQVTLEMSAVGLAAWAVLMVAVLVVLYRQYRRFSARDPAMAGVAIGGLGALTGLLINGLVEYNFGDSEIFMLIVLIMGIAAALRGMPNEESAG